MAFHFRAATVADIPAIRELIAASVRTLQIEYTVEQRELALATVFTVDTQLIADGTYLLAFAADGTFAGCGGWSKRKTLYGGDHQVEAIEPEFLNPAMDAAKIRAIFIHPAFSRQGLGSTILERSENAAKDAGFRRFEMGSTLSGVPLYNLKGYRKQEEIRVPVGAGEGIAVVRMVKEI
jgi:N-acetylglutamate synthase-like GNAT family acetyltransferase